MVDYSANPRRSNILQYDMRGLCLIQCNRIQKFLFRHDYIVIAPKKFFPYLATDSKRVALWCFEDLQKDLDEGRRIK